MKKEKAEASEKEGHPVKKLDVFCHSDSMKACLWGQHEGHSHSD
jgi:hypothetical protein